MKGDANVSVTAGKQLASIPPFFCPNSFERGPLVALSATVPFLGLEASPCRHHRRHHPYRGLKIADYTAAGGITRLRSG